MALYDFRCVFMPYLLRKKASGWEVFHREYGPIGGLEQHASKGDAAILIKLTSSQIKKIAFDFASDGKSFYLYDDRCNPTSSPAAMKNYLARIAVLMKAKIVVNKSKI